MKIFFPLQVFYPSQAGGPANSVYWLTKNLAVHGIKSIVVSTDMGLDSTVPLNRWIAKDYGDVIYTRTRRSNFPLRQILVSLANFRKAEIVHISSVFFPTAFIVSFASRLLGKRIVVSTRGELDPLAKSYAAHKKKPVLWLFRNLLGEYPTFHSTNSTESGYIRDVFGRNSKIIELPNYMELPPLTEREAANYFLFIGRLHPKKAIDLLIEAVSQSTEFMESGYILKIAGKGEPGYEAELEQLVSRLGLEKKVEFIGQIEGVEKQRLFADAYFTVMPSHTENFGNVVLESLAQTTPVVASKGTPWKSLDDERVGFWVDNSPESLAKTLDKIIGMDELEYAGYRDRSRKFVEREYDIRSNIHKWVQVYRDLM